MRKLNKIPAVVLALVLALSLAACGDSFESAMVRALREMQDVESVHADMTLEMAFDFTAEGAEKMSVPISVAMSMDTDGTLTSGTVDVSFLGMPASALYIVENRGEACDLYMSIDGGESWQSQLDWYSNQVSCCTVYITLNEVETLTPTSTSFGAKLLAALRNGWTGFVSGAQAVAVFLVGAWPAILIGAVCGVIYYRVRHPRKKK